MRPRFHSSNKPPYPPGRDPSLQPDVTILVRFQDMAYALDYAEFRDVPYPNLDLRDRQVYHLAYQALMNRNPVNQNGQPYRHPRSYSDRKSRARLTLRALKQVSDGIRPKFKTSGFVIKRGEL